MSNEPRDEQPEPINADSAQEDTDAILSRRRFLIQSGLAGAGIAVGGCEKGGKTDKASGAGGMDKPPKPGICLKVRAPQRDAAVSRPCLSVPERPPMEPGMKPAMAPDMKPRVCLKVRMPRKPDRRATVCLSKPTQRRPKPRKKPRGRICLSAIDL